MTVCVTGAGGSVGPESSGLAALGEFASRLSVGLPLGMAVWLLLSVAVWSLAGLVGGSVVLCG
ncbi:hypothetical protein [Streptomyces sp. NPDC005017]|uniref:hypothetical protein n=1 Tax=Streptomyces sp. NPDC005017 TaxID=3364706 RepID=UPI00368729B5